MWTNVTEIEIIRRDVDRIPSYLLNYRTEDRLIRSSYFGSVQYLAVYPILVSGLIQDLITLARWIKLSDPTFGVP